MHIEKITRIGFVITPLLIACQGYTRHSSNHDVGNACVERVLAMDDTLGRQRNHACEQVSLSRAINDYVNGLREADFTDCPDNFKQAFDSHIRAWINIIQVTDKYPAVRGEMHDLFNQIAQSKGSTEFNAYLAEIWNTWDAVEKLKQ